MGTHISALIEGRRSIKLPFLRAPLCKVVLAARWADDWDDWDDREEDDYYYRRRKRRRAEEWDDWDDEDDDDYYYRRPCWN